MAARDDARAVRAGDRELGGLDETVVGGGGAGLDGGGGSGCPEVSATCFKASPTSAQPFPHTRYSLNSRKDTLSTSI